MKNPEATQEELRHIVWEQMGVRACATVPDEQLHEFLQYKRDEITPSPINKMRDELMTFIEENRNRLILPCDGDCYSHHDGVVIHCHRQLKEKKNGQ
jgi:hypothetical protein